MVYLVLVFGLLNLTLGFALGLYLHHRPQTVFAPVADEPDVPPPVSAREPVRVEPEPDTSPELDPLDPELQTEDIPEEWLDLLEGAETTNSFVEAAIQVLKLEVGKYRDKLVQLENQFRGCTEPDAEVVGNILETLKTVNVDWLASQSEAASHLEQRQGNLGEHSALGTRLEDVLMDQTAQIETTISNIDQLEYADDPSAACRRVVPEMSRLLLMAHELRDRMQDSMAAVLAEEGRLATLDKKMQLDALTEVRNRTGVEQLLDDWWKGDPARTRILSVAVMDIDHFARANELLGAITSDYLLAELAGLLNELMGEERNDHVVARLNGQQFLFFFADCGPRNATATVEQIRQTVAETSFECEDHDIQLTVSAGVVEAEHGDTTATVIARAVKTLKAAKKAGRNCTYVEEESKPTAVTPPEFKVKARIIRVTGGN